MEILKRIKIKQGDITTLNVDAIVNAANPSLLGGGGVDGAIHRKAGPGLLKACAPISPCPTGEARITKGYLLPAGHVIHTVGPVYNGNPEDRVLLRGCYLNCLKIAFKHCFTSIAFPAISCGVYGYPIKDACQIAFHTTVEWLDSNPFPQAVIFILFSDKDFKIYQEILSVMNRS